MDPYRSDTSSLNCPRCAVAMPARWVASAKLHECGKCRGLFVPRDVLVHLIKDRDDASAEAFLEAFDDEAPLEIGARPVTYVHCPACNVVMNRSQFAKGAKVIVDICNCGVWFDAGEFTQVIRFVMDGGIDRAAERIATERARDDAAQHHGPQIERHVVSNRFARSSTVQRTPMLPRNTAAIWSVFETLVKPPRK